MEMMICLPDREAVEDSQGGEGSQDRPGDVRGCADHAEECPAGGHRQGPQGTAWR